MQPFSEEVSNALQGIVGHFEYNKGSAVMLLPDQFDKNRIVTRLQACSDNCHIVGHTLADEKCRKELRLLSESEITYQGGARVYLLDKKLYQQPEKIELQARRISNTNLVMIFSGEEH